MNVVYRFRIYPNKEQQELFAKTFGCVRFIYNRMLAEKMEYYKRTGKNLNLTPAKYKAEFPWLKEVDSLALCNAQLHLQAAYKNFFRDPSVGFPPVLLKYCSVSLLWIFSMFFHQISINPIPFSFSLLNPYAPITPSEKGCKLKSPTTIVL